MSSAVSDTIAFQLVRSHTIAELLGRQCDESNRHRTVLYINLLLTKLKFIARAMLLYSMTTMPVYLSAKATSLVS